MSLPAPIPQLKLHDIKKILIIRLSSFGDIILSFPLIKILKEKFPDAGIDYLTKKKYQEIVSLNPAIDNVLVYGSKLSLSRKEIRENNYDLIIDIHKNFKSIFLSFKNAKLVRRYRKENFKKFLLVKFKVNLFKEIIPVYKKYLQTAGDFLNSYDNSFSTSILNFDKTRKFTEEYIVISPASGHFTKTYPAVKFVEYINSLNEGSDLKVILIGEDSIRDMAICEYIQENAKDVLNLCGKLNIKELAAILYNSEYVICNDSAILHFAEALGKRVISIFGSTVKEFGFFPQLEGSEIFEINTLKCRPCTHIGRESCPLKHFKCMNDIQLIYQKEGYKK